MNNRGMVYIITREDKINDECYIGSVSMDHLELIQEFCDKYNLGYKFNKSQYQDAPIMLAIEGNIVIKTVIDSGNVIMYLPKYITDRQAMWFYNNIDIFDNYIMVGAYIVDSKKDNYSTISGINNIRKYIDKSNILYSKDSNNYSR